MGIIAWIVIGLLAGWLAHVILGWRGQILDNLAVGLPGAIVGGWLAGVLHLNVGPDSSPVWSRPPLAPSSCC